MKKCTLILNTKWGYCLSTIECNSISEALRRAKDSGMAYRIFVDDKCVKRGWEVG